MTSFETYGTALLLLFIIIVIIIIFIITYSCQRTCYDIFACHSRKRIAIIDIKNDCIPPSRACSMFLVLCMLANCHGLLDGTEALLTKFVSPVLFWLLQVKMSAVKKGVMCNGVMSQPQHWMCTSWEMQVPVGIMVASESLHRDRKKRDFSTNTHLANKDISTANLLLPVIIKLNDIYWRD